MELMSPESMAKFAEDVRLQEKPFVLAARETFEALFLSEYRRLRASALESGETSAKLTVNIVCNFDPQSRSVDMTSTPVLSVPRPNRKSSKVN